MNPSYPPISDYGLIGNGQTGALVSRDGAVDWCCWPRYDSPAVFSRLLDAQKGGSFQIRPRGDFEVTREYAERTNVLETTFRTDQGRMRLTDLMPAPYGDEDQRQYPHRILRKVECLEGRGELQVHFHPRFDYARQSPRYRLSGRGAVARGSGEALSLVAPVPLEERAGALHANLSLEPGNAAWFVLTHGPVEQADQALHFEVQQAEDELEQTLTFWRDWSDQCRYDGPYRDLVVRSALVLKLLAFQPTGGLIAAPTTSLPAEIGGIRNWDYRYTWLRDSGLLLDSLQQLGYHDESMRFIDWLEELCLQCDDELRVVYAIDGEPAADEHELNHLTGYRNTTPVRIGNGASGQTQTDTFGHVIDAVVLCYERMPRPMKPELWDFLSQLADQAAAQWQHRDKGPWEMRKPPQHYLYSKLYCWVGLDRAVRFAEQHDLPGNLENWKEQRASIRNAIVERGYNAKVGAFTQAFDNAHLDASALAVPLVGLLPASDSRVVSTREQIRRELAVDSLVYRYRMDDGLAGHDATFTLCSFWLVMNLALSGEHEEATRLFERLCGFANDLGLMSEQIDPDSGVLLGNFPQGFSHVGMIRAAHYLHESQSEQHD